MHKQCKGCVHHHNAGHPKVSKHAVVHNDWCCRLGRTAKRALGECRLKELKEEKLCTQLNTLTN